ncbi:MAG: dethiobiotin synthase [Mycobacterium sp.]
MTVIAITGTGTGVGKTIATAALACHARAAGIDVAVCKPVQTGADDDLAVVSRLSGATDLVSVARYPDPLAPAAAAAAVGRPLPEADEIVAAVRAVDRPDRLTLVEGAGGLLVEIAGSGITLRDLAVDLDAAVLVVCAAGLGTLNHVALTLEALENRGLSCAGLVIGSWPADPGMAEDYNRGALARMAPVRAVLPAGAGEQSPSQFAEMSRQAFDTAWVAGLS